ncbi:MAG: DUF4194 domain-containing protein [Hyphomicrobiaceae bacterium]
MSDTKTASPRDALPTTVIALMKGVVEREHAPGVWQDLLRCTSQVRDHIRVIGLELVLNEAEGYAYLRQRPELEGETPLPRLVPRRQLTFSVSLMLALLRRRLAEADASSGERQLVLTREEIHDLVRHIWGASSNEAKLADRRDRDIDKIVELGFLRPLARGGDAFEVRRILAAFIDAQWLSAFDEGLATYEAHARQTREAMRDG